MSLVCSLSRAYAHHQFTGGVTRPWCTLPWRAGQARVNSLATHIIYFVAISCVGYLVTTELELKAPADKKPRGIDMFFTAVSAATVSSMSTVEMEVFSNAQLLVLTLLMFIGGEVFVSLVGLASKWFTLRRHTICQSDNYETELETVTAGDNDTFAAAKLINPMNAKRLQYNSVRALFYVVLAIIVVVHVVGAMAVAAYVYMTPSARTTLASKALNIWTFAVFTTVSTFSNCGYMPTNENMMPFRKNTSLQLMLVQLVLAGNTLFPALLASCVWLAGAATRREEFAHMLRIGRVVTGYHHLLPTRRCWMLAATVVGLLAVQVTMVCALEWGEALQGMSRREKVMNALFLAVNTRHSGESTVDISTLAPAILVLFVLMMYLPPYTTWFPYGENSNAGDHHSENQEIGLRKSTFLSQLSYLTIFITAICITERRKLKEDPLNFNVLSIVVEVVSAYGNVGFSMGYSCSRQINPDQLCRDRWTGFAGRWSDSGKIILIFVMFFGRLKKFSMKGGKAWKLG